MSELCGQYCNHGGVCPLPNEHDGLHDSGYCTWTDAQSITREEADRLLLEQPNALAADFSRFTGKPYGLPVVTRKSLSDTACNCGCVSCMGCLGYIP